MVFVNVKIGLRNRFTFNLTRFAEDNNVDKAIIDTAGVTPQRERNRFVLSVRKHGTRNGTIFRLELLLIYENAVAGDTGGYDWSATFRDFGHRDRGFSLYPELDRLPWTFFEETLEVDEIMDDKWGFIKPSGVTLHVPL